MNNNLEDKVNYYDSANYSIKDAIAAYKNIIINYTKNNNTNIKKNSSINLHI